MGGSVSLKGTDPKPSRAFPRKSWRPAPEETGLSNGGRQAISGMWKSQSEEGGALGNPSGKRASGVDRSPTGLVPLRANFEVQPSSEWVTDHDADVQAPEPEEKEQARFSGADEDQGGSQDPEPASPERPAAAGGERRLQVGPLVLAHPDAGALGRFRLPPSSRVTRARDIRALLREGKRKKTSHLDVFFLSSGDRRWRLGFVVPKHRRRVVDRNRLKRRLREIGRRELLPRLRASGPAGDLLIRARAEAYGAGFQQLRSELIQVAEELCSGQFSWR